MQKAVTVVRVVVLLTGVSAVLVQHTVTGIWITVQNVLLIMVQMAAHAAMQDLHIAIVDVTLTTVGGNKVFLIQAVLLTNAVATYT